MGLCVSKTKYRIIKQQLEEAKNKNRVIFNSLNSKNTDLSNQNQQLCVSEYEKKLKIEKLESKIQEDRITHIKQSIITQEEIEQQTERWNREKQKLIEEKRQIIEEKKNFETLLIKIEKKLEDAEEQAKDAKIFLEKQKILEKELEVKKAEENIKKLEEDIKTLQKDKETMINQISNLQQENQKLSQYLPTLMSSLKRCRSTKEIEEDLFPLPIIWKVQSTYEQYGNPQNRTENVIE